MIRCLVLRCVALPLVSDSGFTAQLVGTLKTAPKGAYHGHVENHGTGFDIGQSPLGRDQLIFRGQYVEIGGKLALVARADHAVRFGGGGDGGTRCGEFPVEGFTAGRRIRHFVQRVGQCRVVGGYGGVILGMGTAQLALQAFCIEYGQRNRGADAADVGTGLGQIVDAQRLNAGECH